MGLTVAPGHPNARHAVCVDRCRGRRCPRMRLYVGSSERRGGGQSEIALSASYPELPRVGGKSRFHLSEERFPCHQRQFRWSKVSVKLPGSR